LAALADRGDIEAMAALVQLSIAEEDRKLVAEMLAAHKLAEQS
jgi:hypothetical protein